MCKATIKKTTEEEVVYKFYYKTCSESFIITTFKSKAINWTIYSWEAEEPLSRVFVPFLRSHS